jgi:hypothetical protein
MKIKLSNEGEFQKAVFFCDGCGCDHQITVGPDHLYKQGLAWGFNGDVEKPTFTPSILVRATKFTEEGQAQYDAWAARGYTETPEVFDFENIICHSYVGDGMIAYLSDSTHTLAGQTVHLPEYED